MRRAALLLAVLLASALTPAGTGQAATFTPGAPGIGDPYFPLDGNGGYDVGSYDLALSYDPTTDRLSGTATIRATATQDLSRFDLDLVGLTVRTVTVQDRPAVWFRKGGELVIVPRTGLPRGSTYTTVVRYDGVPETLPDGSGFIHTRDGALVVGQPRVAATWFPANDHPADKATFTFRISVPAGLEVVANGLLADRTSRDDRTTWTWRASTPMAPYLATASIGQWQFDKYDVDGLPVVDAIDPTLFRPVAQPHSGRRFAISQVGNDTYRRLTRVVPGGQTVTFWVNRQTEPSYDFFLVEARTAGGTDWTTLRDANGHTRRTTGDACPDTQAVHPWLTHYQSPDCAPRGTSGVWHAASGSSRGWEQWALDLSAYSGDVELSLAYVTDSSVQGAGVFVDDIVVPVGAGSTSFEDGLAGWTAGPPPAGSPPLTRSWIAGGVADAPPPIGVAARSAFTAQPEVLGFLADTFGAYPFDTAGGIVDELTSLSFALENQTRPIYPPDSFGDRTDAVSLIAHELAHQWYGDSLALFRWRDIWLNEGFATYGEWLWSEHVGGPSAQQIFAAEYARPAYTAFWRLRIGDPGPGHLFATAVYQRGAMTLHALRLRIGEPAFFALLPTWSTQYRGGNVTTAEFIELAEDISGQQLDDFFDAWLYTSGKPAL